LDGVDSAIACEPRVHDTPAPAASPSARATSYRVALVAAIASNGVIGVGGTLPWRIPDDLRLFRALTTGHTVIMGRKTWESLGRALPNRQNIVVSRRRDWVADGAVTAQSLADAIDRATLPPPICVIGGGELYRAALPLADVLYLTEVHRAFDGDAWFPSFDRDLWREVTRQSGHTSAPVQLGYDFVTYERANAVPTSTQSA
jgi:dihydrofolate reductase